MAEKADITPKVIKWARESAKMSLETSASKVGVSEEKINEWEEGCLALGENLLHLFKHFLFEVLEVFERDYRGGHR